MDIQQDGTAVASENAVNAETQGAGSSIQQESAPSPEQQSGPDPARIKVPAYYDPNARLDSLSQRILAIELANGVGLSARLIKEIGNLAIDEDTINKRRRTGAYQKVMTEMRKDALELIAETQAKAIRKLREQLDSKDEKIAQRAALFFGESTMSVHMKRAEAELQLELQKRAQTFVKKTIIEFEMDDSIPVLGEPPTASPKGASSAEKSASTAPSAAAAPGAPDTALPSPSALPEPSQAPARPSEATKPTDQVSTPVQESSKNSASQNLAPQSPEISSESESSVPLVRDASSQPQDNTTRIAADSNQDQSADSIPDRAQEAPKVLISAVSLPSGNEPAAPAIELESDDEDVLGGIND